MLSRERRTSRTPRPPGEAGRGKVKGLLPGEPWPRQGGASVVKELGAPSAFSAGRSTHRNALSGSCLFSNKLQDICMG